MKAGIIKNKYFLGRPKISSWLLILPFLFFLTFILLVPTVQGMIWSFFKMRGYNVEGFCGFDNYINVVKNSEFKLAMINNFRYLLWYLLLEFWPPILVAILLNETRRMKNFYQFFIYSPTIMPAIGVSLLWYFMYYPDASGLLNMVLVKFGMNPVPWLQNASLTIPMMMASSAWRSIGASMLIYLASLQAVNPEMYEAAMLDGAGFWYRVRKITLPQMAGVILLQLARGMVTVFRIMDMPLAMTGGGPNGASTPLGLLAYRYAFQTYNVGGSLAVNVIVFLLLVILTGFYFVVKNKVEQEA